MQTGPSLVWRTGLEGQGRNALIATTLLPLLRPIHRRGWSAAVAMSTYTKEQLEALSKSELVDLVLGGAAAQLQAKPPPTEQQQRPRQEPKKTRAFDMSRYEQRHVALRVAYIGTAYAGSAWQDNNDTIVGRLFEALTKTCLITDRESCGHSLGGRTDKGVSALGQVVALRMRSNLSAAELAAEQSGGDGAAASADADAVAATADAGAAAGTAACVKKREEIDYVRVLNRVLPDDIRVLAAQPVPDDFSARFSATHRTYKYFFVRGELQLEPMRDAAARLVGELDFRNFCKIDPTVSNFRRTVLSAAIQPAAGAPCAGSPLDMFELEVRGTAFLYHQVRCMMAVLFLVGRGLEPPRVVDELLDIATHPARPNYEIAPDAALLLYDIGYDGVAWRHSAQALEGLARHWGQAHEALALRAAMLLTKRDSLLDCAVPVPSASASASAAAVPGGGGGGSFVPWRVAAAAAAASGAAQPQPQPQQPHVPLFERPTAASVEMVAATQAGREARKNKRSAPDSGK